MNNLLLLITLIFGFVGQTAQAVPLRLNHETTEALLASYKYLHRYRYLLPNYQILKTENLLKKHVEKYHPGFNFKWFISTKWEADEEGRVGVPLSFMVNNNDGLAAADHEIGHILKNHISKQEEYKKRLYTFSIFGRNILSKSNEKKYYEFLRETEREADAVVPNDPYLLLNQQKRYEKLASLKDNPDLIEARKLCPIKVQPKEIDLTHPPLEERAAHFKERREKLILGYSVIDPNEREKQGIPPAIFDPRPRLIARERGWNEKYYADVSADMLRFFKPTAPARYFSTQQKRGAHQATLVRAFE